MKRIGKMFAVILGAGLLAAVGTMFNPRTTHALVAVHCPCGSEFRYYADRGAMQRWR